MQGPSDETVGEKFQVDLLQQARDLTLSVLKEAAASVRPGMTEEQAKTLVGEIQTKMGASRTWHPPQIRFGKNTTLPFGQPGVKDYVLADNDIFFLDLGIVFNDHEGDVGRAYTVGTDAEKERCARDVEEIWNEVREHWRTEKATGGELYSFATESAKRRGWELSLKKANGHRISDFPHAARIRGSIEGWEAVPAANRWILEIQIVHPSGEFGAFYEDLLN